MTSRGRARRLHPRRQPVMASRAPSGGARASRLEARKSQYYEDLETTGLTEEDVEHQPLSDYLLNGPAEVGDVLFGS